MNNIISCVDRLVQFSFVQSRQVTLVN